MRRTIKLLALLIALLATGGVVAGTGAVLYHNAVTGHAYPADLGSAPTTTGYVLTIKTLSPLDAYWAPGGGVGRLLAYVVLTTTATATSTSIVYTPANGTTYEEIEYLGGGGGSAWCFDGGTLGEAVGGGAAGEDAFLTNTGTPVLPWNYYCGPGGSAGVSTSTTTTGGDTVVKIGSTAYIAKGGAGASLSNAASEIISSGGAGVAHSTGGVPVWSFPGAPGTPGVVLQPGLVMSGAGGNARYGAGGSSVVLVGTSRSSDGNPGTGFSAGAGGCAFAHNSGHMANGAAGAPGVILVRDYQ